ncbi:MAG: GyrI-like domain-containing protein [Caulobacterales bacterium]
MQRALAGAAALVIVSGAFWLARRNDVAAPVSISSAEAATVQAPMRAASLRPGEAPMLVNVDPQLVALIGASAPRNPSAVAQAQGAAYAKITAYLEGRGIQMAGAPMMITTKIANNRVQFDAGIPVANEGPYDPGTGVRTILRPAFKAVKVVNVGPYESLDAAYSRLDAYVAANGLEPVGQPWESYIDDPTLTPPEQLRTEVFVPVR